MSAVLPATGRPGTGRADSAALAACDTAPNIGDLTLPMSTRDTAVPATGPPTPTWSAVSQCALDRADAILAELRRTRENYHMLDDEFQLPILEARYLADSAVPADGSAPSCSSAETGAPPRLALLLRELALVAAETQPYAERPDGRPTSSASSSATRPTGAPPAGATAMPATPTGASRWTSTRSGRRARWRRSPPSSPPLPGLGIGRATLDSLAPERAAEPLAAYLADLDRAAPRRSTPGTEPGGTSWSRSTRDEIARRDRGQAGLAPGGGARATGGRSMAAAGRRSATRSPSSRCRWTPPARRSRSSTPTPRPSSSWTRRPAAPGQLEAIEAFLAAVPGRPVRRGPRATGRQRRVRRAPRSGTPSRRTPTTGRGSCGAAR